MRPYACLLLTLCLLGGCATRTPPAADAAPAAELKPEVSDRRLLATLYQQTAVEYAATLRTVYAAASAQLDAALATPGWTAVEEQRGNGFENLPPAIIVDVDETVLDNAPFQARRIDAGLSYDEAAFQAWSNENAAAALPGAVDFLALAKSRGVAVFYVTNRAAATQDATVKNLARWGFPDAVPAHVLAKTDTSDKGIRRTAISANYRVIMLFGDNFGDFTDCYKPRIAAGVDSCTDLPETTHPVKLRAAYAAMRADWWGNRWFMLPNPSYGSWLDAITRFDRSLTPAEIDALSRAAMDRTGSPPAP